MARLNKRGPSWWRLKSGIPEDVRGRLPFYKDDWVQGLRPGLRILAPSVYIFFCSAIPALAFGEQFVQETDGILSAVHTLVATGLAGIIQAVVGGQPLLIVGVAEPIVLTYSYMYRFARDKPDLGPDLFVAWAAWTCVWAGVMILALSAAGACRYIHLFTRFSGELFGALIAVLFVQEAVKGLKKEFESPKGLGAPTGAARLPEWRLVNGVWALFLSFGLLLTALLVRQARGWRFGTPLMRSLLADYGVPFMVVVWSGLGYAVAKPAPGGIPRRLQMPQVWEVKSTWSVAGRMGEVPGTYIAGALVPALIITVLFYFDHSVSSQLAQVPEFNLEKPSAYNYDLALLGIITAAFGLIGLPPINGVLPQAPMHTRSLATLRQTTVKDALRNEARRHRGEARPAVLEVLAGRAHQLGSTAAPALRRLAALEGEAAMEGGGSKEPPSSSASTSGDGMDSPAGGSPHAEAFDVDRELDALTETEVAEQRVSGLLQSVLTGACVAISPGLKLIPSAVLWGYFAYMAADSLPGSQFWGRLLLLFTDPRQRYKLVGAAQPYVLSVPMRVVAAFTLLQLLGLGAVYGITWAGIVGVIFPVFIMALVPFRRYIMPRLVRKEHLRQLDEAPFEDYSSGSASESPAGESGSGDGGSGRGGGGKGASADLREGSRSESGGSALAGHASSSQTPRRRAANGRCPNGSSRGAGGGGGTGAASDCRSDAQYDGQSIEHDDANGWAGDQESAGSDADTPPVGGKPLTGLGVGSGDEGSSRAGAVPHARAIELPAMPQQQRQL